MKIFEKLKTSNSVALYRKLLPYMKPFLWPLSFALLGNILFSGVDASFTYLLKPILNKGFIAKDLQFIKLLPFLILGAFIVRGLAHFVGLYGMAMVSRGVVMNFRRTLFQHLMRLPASYYDKISSGQVLSTILYNVEQVAASGADALTDFLQSSCLIIGFLIIMFSISWRFSLLYIVAMPVIALCVNWSTQRIRRISLGIQNQMGTVTSIAEEAIEGYKVIRSFGGEAYEINKFDQATQNNRYRELKSTVTRGVMISVVQLIAGFALATTIYFATSKNTTTQLSPGAFVALVVAMLALLKPLKTFMSVNAIIQKGLAGAQSIFELLEIQPEKDEGLIVIPKVQGKVEFQAVSFSYQQSHQLALDRVNFLIQAGQAVALVGHSGGGKSTIVNLLQRFYDHFSGKIAIDDIDIRQFKLSNLRQQFALVSQHIVLFNDTIARNIAYGCSESVTETAIIEATKAADAWDFIQTFPQGIHTLIGDNGTLLSGGQRQRIAIARAILKNAPILILDEATSALDTLAERKIQAAIETLMQHRTTLIIAHRLSTIEKADMILVVDQGQIKESGDHHSLLAKGGYYAELYKMQFHEP
jgi:ATP-binding cassette, subfamily B, bacterial MsbA